MSWQYQRSAAERIVQRLAGVRGVVSSIAVKPEVSESDVKAKIEGAFRRSAEIDAHRVTVQAAHGTVVLTGTVRSLFERDEAERAAWAAPGVTRVDDRLIVAP